MTNQYGCRVSAVYPKDKIVKRESFHFSKSAGKKYRYGHCLGRPVVQWCRIGSDKWSRWEFKEPLKEISGRLVIDMGNGRVQFVTPPQ